MPWRRLLVPQVDMAAVTVLLGATLLVHLPAIVLGRIPMQDDVKVFYFPLMVATGEALRHGTVPFWTPSVFGGYPLFSDGEAGMLYPLNLLILPWTAPETALIWLRVIHTFLSGLFSYSLLRTLRCQPIGAVTGALVYALSGFAAGQIVHSNVSHAIVWLPLEIALVERAWRSQGLQRVRVVLLAGAVMGIQALALHIHITLLSALTVICFTTYRALVPSDQPGTAPTTRSTSAPQVSEATTARRQIGIAVGHACRALLRGIRRGAAGGAIVAGIGGIGVALAAVQLLPLAELGLQTFRGAGLEPQTITAANSISYANLATLVFPHIFDTPGGGYWGPWVKWETTLYVGIAPLLLGMLGLMTRSGPYRPFFGGLALVALLGAFGQNAPVPIWSTLHEVPPFDVLRSPGRFILLFVFSVAVLSAYGVDWLARQSRPHPRWAAVVAVLAAAATTGAWLGLDRLHAALTASPDLLPLLQSYLAVPGVPPSLNSVPLDAERVATLLGRALLAEQPGATWPLTLLFMTLITIAVWFLHPVARHAAGVLTVGLVLVDLSVMGFTFHPYGSIDELRPKIPPVLLQHASAPFRVYTPPTADDKRTQVEPNRLLAVGVEEANGYSSLHPDRHTAFVNAVQYLGNDLLDLWNARFVIQRVRQELLPSYGGTSFHPERPIFSGRRGMPGASGIVLPEGGDARVDQVQIVAALWDTAALADGTIAARIKLTGTDGAEQSLFLRVGSQVSDARLERPDPSTVFQHGRAEVAFQFQRVDPLGHRYGEQLYHARLPVQPPMTVRSVEVQNVLPSGGLEVFGIGLWNAQTDEITQARALAKLRLVHADEQVRVFENTSVMPRAFLVPAVTAVPAGRNPLASMVNDSFDPRRIAMVECETPDSRCGLPAGLFSAEAAVRPGAVGTATFKAYEDQWSVIQTSSDRDALLVISDSFYPGWEARVDGAPATIMRADSLFRAVAVPAGTHTVDLTFAPASVAVGGIVTLATAALMLLTWLAYAFAWALRRRGSLIPRPVRTGLSPAPVTE